MRGEFKLIERLKAFIPRRLQGTFPIGDDAAILTLPNNRKESLIFTTDAIVEGVDFRLGRRGAAPEVVGHKALAVNLSDIAAMGGKPVAFVAAFGIPGRLSQAWVERMAKGIIRLARRFGVAWVGGDISRASRLFVSIALLGKGKRGRLVARSGARRGDSIYVTGTLGGSIEGKHLLFTPRLREAQFLLSRCQPTAMIDLSDGFIQDLGHILRASRVGARVELGRIPISRIARKRSGASHRRALRSALSDGEDFELLFTLSPRKGRGLEGAWPRAFPRVPLTKVGEIVPPPAKVEWYERGKKLRRLWFRKKGFTHF